MPPNITTLPTDAPADSTTTALLNSQYCNPAVVDTWSDDQLESIVQASPIRWNSTLAHIGHQPTTKQMAFLMAPQREVLYGGAAGGGKSDALLMAALQYVDVPGYSALLIRRTYADLEKPGGLLHRAQEWLANAPGAHWNGRRWRFASGAILDFGYLDHLKDRLGYQSSEYQFIGFDEVTQLEQENYRYLFSRARRTVTRGYVPIRVRAATNPGGPGHQWVYQRFVVEGLARGRLFIKAYLEDNPYLDQEEYDLALQELDPVTRRQLRMGDWSIRPAGMFFNQTWFDIIDEDDCPPDLVWTRMWDLAATKNQSSAFTAGSKTAFHNGQLYISDIQRIKGDPGEVETLVGSTAQRDGIGVAIWMEKEPGSGGVNTMWHFRFNVLKGFDFNEYSPHHDKLTRAMPLSSLAKAHGIKLVRRKGVSNTWISNLLDEADAFPNSYRDQIDTLSASLLVHSQRPTFRVLRT